FGLAADAIADADLRRLRDLHGQLGALTAQLRAAERAARPDGVRRARHIERLTAVRGALDDHLARLRKAYPRYASLYDPQPSELRAVQAALGDGELLLAYLVGARGGTLFAVTRDALTLYPLPAADVLRTQVDGLVDSLRRPRRLRRARDLLAARLAETLLAPVAAQLAASTRVVIAPDGPLHALPFAALPGTDDAPLGASRALAHVPSASALVGLRAARAPTARGGRDARVALIGHADAAGLRPLPAVAREIDAIVDVVTAASPRPGAAVVPPLVLVGADAREARVKRDPDIARARVLHFAGHARAGAERARSGALALAPGDGEDGTLHADEIFALRLEAELVVLSACDSLGGRRRGEGLVGLGRAFFYAGTHSLIGTLWPVDDGATAAFMAAFYRHRRDAPTVAEALRRTQAERRAIDPAPRTWAPFVYVGAP
ncbi:MAG: CHAT domain-containing protein, partial [Acidobacteriota bacterium]